MTEPELTITVYDRTVGSDALHEAVALYREIYAEPPYRETSEDFEDFSNDLLRRTEQQDFRLVIARSGSLPLGFALGHQLTTTSRWWEGATTPLAASVTTEYPGRTFAIIELAVRLGQRRAGLGSQLHAHLTAGASVERLTLLVRPDAKPARSAYLTWGYRIVTQIHPFPNGPIYDAMTLSLK